MSIRTLEHLSDYLSEDLAWRKKELSSLNTMIEWNKLNSSKTKGSVNLMYAHWEGFSKNASMAYIEFVSNRQLPFKELKRNFLAIYVKKRFHEASSSKKIHAFNEIVDFFLDDLNSKSNLPKSGVINTRSNLSSEVLREMIKVLGLDYTPFLTKENLIDIKLLKRRNSIAHGEYLDLDEEEYEQLFRNIILLMDEFRNQVDNSAYLETYKVA